MNKQNKYTFKITVYMNTAPSTRMVQSYIRGAVDTWGGQYHPDDLLFASNITKVTVSPIKDKKDKVE